MFWGFFFAELIKAVGATTHQSSVLFCLFGEAEQTLVFFGRVHSGII